MAQFTLDVPTEQIPRVKAALLGLYGSDLPLEATADPEADPPIVGWGDAKKIKWLIRHWLIKQVRRWEVAEAKKDHLDPIQEDEGLVDPIE